MQNIKILYVDDDAEDREFFLEALKAIDLDFTLITADNGFDAFGKLEVFLPDIIFLDVNMPMMGGFEFLEKFRLENQHLPVLIFTTSSEENDRKVAKSLGAQKFITKPLEFSKLKAILSEILKV